MMSFKFQGDMLIFYDFIQVFVFTTNHHLKLQLLISILPKNQAAPIEMVISDFFRILKTFIAFVSLCHKSPKPKGKL